MRAAAQRQCEPRPPTPRSDFAVSAAAFPLVISFEAYDIGPLLLVTVFQKNLPSPSSAVNWLTSMKS